MRSSRFSMTSPEQSAPSSQALVTLLYASAVVTAIVAVVLGALVSPILFAIALFSLVDVWLARAYSSGRLHLGSDSARPAEAADADPSYNPYARED
jgi:uncharacterized membrane protein